MLYAIQLRRLALIINLLSAQFGYVLISLSGKRLAFRAAVDFSMRKGTDVHGSVDRCHFQTNVRSFSEGLLMAERPCLALGGRGDIEPLGGFVLWHRRIEVRNEVIQIIAPFPRMRFR